MALCPYVAKTEYVNINAIYFLQNKMWNIWIRLWLIFNVLIGHYAIITVAAFKALQLPTEIKTNVVEMVWYFLLLMYFRCLNLQFVQWMQRLNELQPLRNIAASLFKYLHCCNITCSRFALAIYDWQALHCRFLWSNICISFPCMSPTVTRMTCDKKSHDANYTTIALVPIFFASMLIKMQWFKWLFVLDFCYLKTILQI